MHYASPPSHKKVLLIGAGGAVGLATRDVITQYLGAKVITWDRPINTSEQLRTREERKQNYEIFVRNQNDTLDGQQAKWLLSDYDKLPGALQGGVSSTDTIKAALDQNVDCVVITAGSTRKPDEPRTTMIAKNATFFKKLGREFADIAIENIKADPSFHLPVIINVGNPADTMTEVFGRAVIERLSENIHTITAKDPSLARRLSQEARGLRGKIIGQGGVIDGSRAALAIHEVTGIALEDIINVPVLGTHNDKMVVDLNNTQVKHAGKIIPLTNYPGVDVKAIENEVNALTRQGGSAVQEDYIEKTGISQSAMLATGAAIMQMVDAVVNNKQRVLAAAVYNIPENVGRFDKNVSNGVVIGRLVKLGSNGASEIIPTDPALLPNLHAAKVFAQADMVSAASSAPMR